MPDRRLLDDGSRPVRHPAGALMAAAQRLHGPKRTGRVGSCAGRDPVRRQPVGSRTTPVDTAEKADSRQMETR